jgi:hypothetical protein
MVPVAQSINAGRSPECRDRIVAGEFQRPTCAECEAAFEIDNPFMYVDLPRGQWIGVFATDDESGWREYENEPQEALAVAKAAPAGELVTGNPRVRCVFGLSALREKLILDDHGLDDVSVEVLKFCLVTMAEPGSKPLIAEGRTLRLVDLTNTHFEMISAAEGTDDGALVLSVSREVYDDIVSAAEHWLKLRQFLTTGPYVDAGRVFLGGSRRIS